MGARVSLGLTSASTGLVKLRVGVVAAENAAASIQRVVPATQIAYLDLTLSVLVDTNGFYKLFGDTYSVADAARISASKPFADAVATSEDSVFSFGKAAADTATPSDDFSRVVDFNRLFDDSVGESEVQVFSVDKVLGDDFTTPHYEVFDHQKLVVDGVAMNDGMEAVDGFGIALTRGVSNVTLVGDNSALSFGAFRVESISTQETGYLRSQGYCDFSYFAEDYVGAAQAF